MWSLFRVDHYHFQICFNCLNCLMAKKGKHKSKMKNNKTVEFKFYNIICSWPIKRYRRRVITDPSFITGLVKFKSVKKSKITGRTYIVKIFKYWGQQHQGQSVLDTDCFIQVCMLRWIPIDFFNFLQIYWVTKYSCFAALAIFLYVGLWIPALRFQDPRQGSIKLELLEPAVPGNFFSSPGQFSLSNTNHLSTCLTVCLFVRLSVCRTVCPLDCPFICLFSVSRIVRLTVCPSVRLSIYPSVQISICSYVFLSVWSSGCLFSTVFKFWKLCWMLPYLFCVKIKQWRF